MVSVRRGLLAVGVAVALVAAVVTFAPGLVAGVSFSTAALTVLGVAALLLGYVVYRDGSAERRQATIAETPDVEVGTTVERPGDAVDRMLAGARRGNLVPRSNARDRLRELALRAVVEAESCSREEAERRLDAGSWTDDPHAAAFFAADPGTPPTRLRIRNVVGRADLFDIRFRHALAEIEALSNVEEASS